MEAGNSHSAFGVGRRARLISLGLVVLATAIVAMAISRPAPAEAATPTDVMFVFDTSGSMEEVLHEAVLEIQAVMANIDATVPEVEYGVADVRDFGGSGYDPAEGDQPWNLITPITTNRATVNLAISSLFAEGGGDGPEAYGRALWETDTNPFVGWRSGARHAIVLIADNVPHMPNVNLGIPEALWLEPSPWYTGEELAGTWGIPGTQNPAGHNTEFLEVLHQLAADGKPLEMVDYHDTEENYIHYWEYWAGLSGGHALEAGGGGRELARKLISLIEAAAPPCATVATPTQPSPHPPSTLPAALTSRFGVTATQVTIVPGAGTRFCPGQRPALGGAAVTSFEELTPAQMTFRVPPNAAGGIALSSTAGAPGPASPYEVDNFRFPWGFALVNSPGSGGGRTYDNNIQVEEEDLRSVFTGLGPRGSSEYKLAEEDAQGALSPHGGLCYGFSLISQALYGDSHGPQHYPLGWASSKGFKLSPSTTPYSLRESSSGTHGVTHALLRAALSQNSSEAEASWHAAKSAKAVAADLAPAFSADQPAMLLLWFGKNEGHAVMAYNEQTVGKELVIDVVDPNVPWAAGSSPTDYEHLQVHVSPNGNWDYTGTFSGLPFGDLVGGPSGTLEVVTDPPAPGGLTLIHPRSHGVGTLVRPRGDGTISGINYGISPGHGIPADVEPEKTYIDSPTSGLVVPSDHNTFTFTVKSKAGDSTAATLVGPGFIDSADVPEGESDITVSSDSGAIGAPSAPAGTTLQATSVTGEVQQTATVTFFGRVRRPQVTVGRNGGVTVTTAGGKGRASIKLAAFAPGHESRAPRQIIQIKGATKLQGHTPKVKHHKRKHRKGHGHKQH